MTWGPDVETNLAISSANHLKVRFIQQSPFSAKPVANDLAPAKKLGISLIPTTWLC
ncbi:hypothetical protein [Arsenophonus endosymbiont of Aphis craccivora]|uniref:hypothetical protein n=1 Tax=Arsenophonus endosymbiont of Aphis craccivora TaxID=1231049 RepID=UPI0015DE218F|nr:hypothetical protein [Arsenophonus endosymbiont of Aphis craccivora]